MKIVEIITCTLKIPAKVPLLVGIAGATQKVLTRCYAVSNLNSAERLILMNFPSKYASLHWSMFTSDCRWQRRLAVRYNVEFLEQNGCAH